MLAMQDTIDTLLWQEHPIHDDLVHIVSVALNGRHSLLLSASPDIPVQTIGAYIQMLLPYDYQYIKPQNEQDLYAALENTSTITVIFLPDLHHWSDATFSRLKEHHARQFSRTFVIATTQYCPCGYRHDSRCDSSRYGCDCYVVDIQAWQRRLDVALTFPIDYHVETLWWSGRSAPSPLTFYQQWYEGVQKALNSLIAHPYEIHGQHESWTQTTYHLWQCFQSLATPLEQQHTLRVALTSATLSTVRWNDQEHAYQRPDAGPGNMITGLVEATLLTQKKNWRM